MTKEDFLRQLDARVPEVAELVREHLDFNDGLLLHVLLPDLLRFATQLFAEGKLEPLGRLQDVVAEAEVRGDDYVENAVAVSFVESLGVMPLETPEFIAQLPAPLREELARQEAWAREHHHR